MSRGSAMACPDELEVALWDSGGLERARADEISDHVSTCPTCAGRHARARPTSPEPEGGAGHLGPPAPPGYELLREIHRGGQGAVYEAVQVSTRRHVALKVLHADVGDDDAWARFEREVKLAAQLQHPNVVTVHDSGTFGGRAWIAMELVEGDELHRHVARARPSTEDALVLFRKVCEGVQHAHSRGVLHRDLKPRNVIVDRQGEPRVLDFGIARSLSTTTCGMAGPTAPGDFVGTLSHAAPEQLRGGAVADVRTDVYALGAILYELVTGRLPHDGEDVPELIRQVLEESPVAPSRVAAGTPPDLDAIVLKCLAHAPEHRYQSVLDLQRDVTAFLAGEPIEARRASALATLARRVRRYRAATLVAAAFAAVLAASLAWIAVERERAAAAAAAALRQKEMSSRIAGFLAEVFLGADAAAQRTAKVTVLELVDVARQRLVDPGLDTEARAYLAGVLAHVYVSTGEYERGEALLTEALKGELAVHGPSHEHVVGLFLQRGELHYQRGELASAARWLERALRGGDDSSENGRLGRAEAARMLAMVRVQQGREGEAQALIEESMALVTDPGLRASFVIDLARVHVAKQEFEKAEALLREAVALPADLDLPLARRIDATSQLGQVILRQSRPAEAEPHLRESLAMRRELHSQDTIAVASALSNLAMALRAQGRSAEAEQLLREAIAIHERVEGRRGPFFATMLTNLAVATAAQDRKPEALVLMREAVALTRAAHGDSSPLLARQLHSVSGLALETGQLEDAEAAAREELAILRQLHGQEDPRVAPGELQAGQVLVARGKLAEAVPLLVRARERFVESGGERAASQIEVIDEALAIARAAKKP